jgi:hypothetical protein
VATPAAPRILVVADDESVRELLVRVLQGAGYEILAVQDPPGGLDTAQAAGRADLIVTGEHQVPKDTGAAHWVLQSKLPVVHLDQLNRPEPTDLAEGRLYRAFSAEALLGRIDSVLGNRGNT